MDAHLEWVRDVQSAEPVLERRKVDSAEHLRDCLNDLQRLASSGNPFIVELIATNGASLGIGLGEAYSVAHLKPNGADPPYFISVGDGIASPDSVVFYYQGQWSEFSGQNAVATGTAIAAMEEFLRTGSRPEILRWEEV